MLNTIHPIPSGVHTKRPTASDGVAAALRAVGIVMLVLAALATAALSVLALFEGEYGGIIVAFVLVGILAGVATFIAAVVAMPLGALLARFDVAVAAVLVAPLAGFLVPLALFRDLEFAGSCGAISVVVGVIFAMDPRFRRAG